EAAQGHPTGIEYGAPGDLSVLVCSQLDGRLCRLRDRGLVRGRRVLPTSVYTAERGGYDRAEAVDDVGAADADFGPAEQEVGQLRRRAGARRRGAGTGQRAAGQADRSSLEVRKVRVGRRRQPDDDR